MKKFSAFFLAVLTVFCLHLGISSSLAESWPDTIRIGNYYGGNSISSVSFSSKAGLEVGSYVSDSFDAILSVQGGSGIIIRKDAYFIKSSSGVTSSYDPSEGKPYDGETVGPYHIRIGGSVQSYSEARRKADQLLQSGIVAYPVFEDGWYVWTGFYSEGDEASEALKTIADVLGTSDLEVISPSSSRIVVQNSYAQPLLVFCDGQKSRLRVRPISANNPCVLSVNGKQYRGEFEIRRYPDSDLTVINILDIEEYLYGVVPQEIEASAPAEALKAQAVVARTYAYKNLGKYSKWGFDLTNTTSDQVYGGYDAENQATNMAVDQTRGKKILYNGSVISAFYFSSSGGMTEDSENVWGTAYPYLRSVPDPYESGTSYNYNWSRSFTADEIEQILYLSGMDIGDLVSITVEKVSTAGRPIKVTFTGTRSKVTYYRQDVRNLLNLPSNLYTISTSSGSTAGSASKSVYAVTSEGTEQISGLEGRTIITSSGTQVLGSSETFSAVTSAGVTTVSGSSSSSTGTVSGSVYLFTGKGWGHAVGMSQEGAKGFARQGYTYEQIIKHYFTGVTIE